MIVTEIDANKRAYCELDEVARFETEPRSQYNYDVDGETEVQFKAKLINTLIRVVWGGCRVQESLSKGDMCDRAGVDNNFQNAFLNRIKGFIAELIFYDHTMDQPEFFRGGWFVPKYGGKDPLSKSQYFTVSGTTQRLVAVYMALSDALPDIPLFAIVPKKSAAIHCLSGDSFEYFQFVRESGRFDETSSAKFYSFWSKKKGESQLPQLDIAASENERVLAVAKSFLQDPKISIEALKMLLFDRYIFDAEISLRRWRGRPTDLDFLKIRPDGRIYLIDVKDKYLSANGKLGLNRDHLPFFERIDLCLGTQSKCLVRVSEESGERSLKGWYFTAMRKFTTAKDSAGNPGMNGDEAKRTPMISLEEFKKLYGIEVG